MSAARAPWRKNKWFRIQAVALVMYVISQIDRSNIALAFPGMRRDLGFSATALGFATGLFFWGYILLQIPLGRLASVWSPKRIIFIQGVGWSVLCLSTALVQTKLELQLNRFFLGVVEGGVLPTMMVLIRAWFTPKERARANLILLGTPIAIAVGNPMCGAAVQLVGWRLMFVITAVPALLWSIVWWFSIDDTPSGSKWLPLSERRTLTSEIEDAKAALPRNDHHWSWAILQKPVLVLALYNFLGLTAFWGLAFWLPTLLVESGRSIGLSGVLSALPYVCSVGMAVLLSRSSDRWQERKWHTLVPTALAGVFMILSSAFGTQHTTGLLICLTMTASLWFGRISIYWVWVGDLVAEQSTGAAMAFANGMGNLGGFFGPFVFGWLRSVGGDFERAMMFGGTMFVAAFCVGLIMRDDRRSQHEVANRPTALHQR